MAFLSAKEAAQQTKEVIERIVQEQLATLGWLDEKIQAQIKKGKNYYELAKDEELTEQQISALKTKCYSVKTEGRRNDITVTWPLY